MKKRIVLAMMAVLLLSSAVFASDGWKKYKATDYGFSMLIPEGTEVHSKEYGGGWGGFYCGEDPVHLYGVAKLGKPASAEDIENFGVELTGIPHEDWKEVSKGKNENGWTWYKQVRAEHGKDLVFGIYGVGPSGSYLLILQTTKENFKEYKADYDKWYGSLKLN